MAKLMDQMGKMIGPLPLGAWIIAVGLGVGIIAWNRKTDSDNTGYVDEEFVYRDTSSDTGVGVGGSGLWTDLTVPSTGTTSTNPSPTTNEEWGRLALNRAIGMGFNPTVADFAIRTYLASGNLDASGWAIINDLLRLLGAPPSALGPSDYKPTPTPKPPTAGTGTGIAPSLSYISHVVRYGETLAVIASAYGVRWATLYNANKSGSKRADNTPGVISNPSYIAPGTRLVIPGVSGTPKRLPIKYTVKAGDTISTIATKLGVRWADVYNNNKSKIPNTAKLKPGTVLTIP